MNTLPVSTADGPGASQAPSLAATGPVVCVRTTKIYCRPVCRPARMPRPENCVLVPSAQAAREAGYRPCKLCRPDELVPPERLRRKQGDRGVIRYGIGPVPVGHAFLACSERGVCLLY